MVVVDSLDSSYRQFTLEVGSPSDGKLVSQLRRLIEILHDTRTVTLLDFNWVGPYGRRAILKKSTAFD